MLPCAFPARSIFPLMPCGFPARSRFPMLPCAFPTGKCFPACSCFPIALRIGTSAGSCFPMLPQRLPLEHLPRSSFRTAATRGAVTSSRLRWKCLSMDCICPQDCCCSDIANLSAHLHRLLTPPPYLLLMRLSPGQVRRSCKSPRARILVLGTSGAHWPARWPQFVLTERVDKS